MAWNQGFIQPWTKPFYLKGGCGGWGGGKGVLGGWGMQQQQHPSPARLYADLFINLGWSRCAAHVENPEHVAGT